MAMSKAFHDGVMSIAAKGAALAEKLQGLGAEAVRAAYANADCEKAQFMLDNLPQYMRKPLASWLRRAGLNILFPVTGSARFDVQGVLDQKRQSKAFEFVEKTPVLVIEAEIKQPKKEKPLEGTPEDRASKAVAAIVSRLREKDPETAALINEAWAGSPKLCLINAQGGIRYLTPEDYEVCEALLQKREGILRAA